MPFIFVEIARNNLLSSTNSSGMNADDETRLALRWSLPNIIENQLLTNTTNWNDPRKVDQNQALLLDALSQDLNVVVRNFLQLDIDLSDLFASRIESDLWRGEEKWTPGNEYLQDLYSESRRTNVSLCFVDDDLIENYV